MQYHKKTGEQSLGDLIQQLFDINGIEKQIREAHLRNWWHETMGTATSQRTKHIALHKETLFIYLDSAPLRHQLSLQKNKIKQSLDQARELNPDKTPQIRDIVFR